MNSNPPARTRQQVLLHSPLAAGATMLTLAAVLLAAAAPHGHAAAAAADPAAALRAAEARARDAETLTRLSTEGQVLYRADPVKLDGYGYCSQSVALAERGEFRRSIRAASRALYLGRTDGDDRLTALAQRDLAIAYNYAGQLDLAERYARESLASKEADAEQVVAPAHKILGDVLARRGQWQAAAGEYAQAAAVASARFLPLVHVALANAHASAGQLEQAGAIFAALRIPADSPIHDYSRRAHAGYLLLAGRRREALALFQAVADGAHGTDAAYHRFWALEGVARSHVALGDRVRGRAAYGVALEALESVRSRFRSEEFKLGLFGDVQQVFERAIVLATDAGDHESAWRLSERSRARALLDMVRDRLPGRSDVAAVERTPGRAAATLEPVPELSALRSGLRTGEALVEFHVMTDRVLAWVVRPSGLTAARIELGGADLATSIETLRAAIFALDPVAPERAADLGAKLLGPLGLVPGERLAVVPHGALHYLPFQALRISGQYVVERHALSVVPSAAIAHSLAARSSASSARLVAFGNPRPDDTYDLPAAEQEVERIGAMFPERLVFRQAEASLRNFRRHAGASQVLHVAAHAELDAVDPLYSRILLAPERDDNGLLEAHEIFGMDFRRADLVALSACESGLGRIARGDEMLGFTRSFLSAGAGNLLVSLWPVEDESTALMMTTLYSSLHGGADLRDSIRTAQRAVLAHEGFSHPFYWAPFSLVGVGRAHLAGETR